MAIVYRHRRLDNNQIFYVGIGKTEKRAYNKNNNRNKFWKNIVNKTKYSVEIIANNLIWDDACELEILLIQEYGRRDLKKGNLVNMTDGGDGSTGHQVLKPRTFSEITRKRMSDSQKRNGISELHRFKLNEGHKNMSDKSRANMLKTQFQPKPVIDIKTSILYKSVKELSKISGISYDVLKKKLTNITFNNTNYRYL